MQTPGGQTQQAMPDSTRGVLRRALILLLVWCALEGTVFAFAVRPTMSELLSDLTGFTANPIVIVVLLSIFLTIVVAGSFVCLQVLTDAIAAKQIGIILPMIMVQVAIAMFQVLFLYRELIDQITPWLAQQGMTLGTVATFGLASLAWVAVRGMTWFTFARSGAPALIALLNRQAGRSTTQI